MQESQIAYPWRKAGVNTSTLATGGLTLERRKHSCRNIARRGAVCDRGNSEAEHKRGLSRGCASDDDRNRWNNPEVLRYGARRTG